ncbi:MAG: sigma-70 family RNA polymerase sigma factor [Oscillospiraceae bacterium]|jgi:RNA polymerase sigma-70 factor (ECF subfamily)|nr:sigma-70 family RNA polymerase sigma factor [Oscillospiraceae bacterium]
MDGDLPQNLKDYIRRKFASRPGIADCAEDIVQQAFVSVLKSPGYTPEQLNFGYLSKAALRIAYKYFQRANAGDALLLNLAPLVKAEMFADELASADDTEVVLNSLETLREFERIVVEERYYGQFSFAEIAARHGLNLNTVLSHHRRALLKLRSELSPYFAPTDNNYHYGGS